MRRRLRAERGLTPAAPHSMAERSMSTSSPFIRGIFFFLFLGKESTRKGICARSEARAAATAPVKVSGFKNTFHILQDAKMKGTLILVPSALGVTGDVVFEAVLLYLKHMVKGSVQFLHRHLNGTLRTSTDSD